MAALEARNRRYNPVHTIGETLQEKRGKKEIENPLDILVIGAGISGITTGLCLLDEGHAVTLWAKDLPPNTTSNVAGAVWAPYKADPPEKIVPWGQITYDMYTHLESNRKTGIVTREITILQGSKVEDPWWISAVKNFRHSSPQELPPDYNDAYVFDAPVVDTFTYLGHLLQTFQDLGGRIVQRPVDTLSQAFYQYPIVVNCTGLGARELVGDTDIHAARGQVIRINSNGFDRVVGDEDGPNAVTYIIPRLRDTVIGGSFEEFNESLDVDKSQVARMLARIQRIAPDFPRIKQDDIRGVFCGLRPIRSQVRLEAENVAPDRLLLHNYGHGGSGVTLSWGCAAEVVDLVNRFRS